MNRINDLTGKRFGRLIALSVSGKYKKLFKWLCQCDCGNKKEIVGVKLTNGHTKSCGCLKADTAVKNYTTHGLSKHPIHGVWKNMMTRCYNKNNNGYKWYGGRGILVCERWHDFKNFYDDMSVSYKSDLWLDRLNNNDGYSPINCAWKTKKEQARNKRNNVIVQFEGSEITAPELAEKSKLKIATVYFRLKSGWSVPEIMSTPINEARRK